MEGPAEEQGKMSHQQQEEEEVRHDRAQKKKGGLVTMPFIIVNESLEKVASYGLLPNMIMYLMKDYRMSLARGTNLLFFWSAATNFMPIVGAFLADSYLGRFLTIGFGSFFSFLGVVVLWLTTMIPQSKPAPCNPLAGTCEPPTGPQYAILVLAFTLMSIGAGGVRPCSQAFDADLIDEGLEEEEDEAIDDEEEKEYPTDVETDDEDEMGFNDWGD